MTSLELLICAVLIFVSACLSASEIALFSLSRFQLRSLKESFRSIHRRIKHLLGDPGGLLITILVVNEVLNISLSTLITKIVTRGYTAKPIPLIPLPPWALETVLGIVITAPIILFLCEITPKVIAARTNQLVATLAAAPVTFIYKCLRPVRFVLQKVVGLVSRWTTLEPSIHELEGLDPKNKEAILKESDFLLMVEEGHKEGAIQESEFKLIRNVFELDNTMISEISTPLSQVLSLPVHTTVKGALSAVRSQRYSRIPITGSNRNDVVGILYSKDLLRSKLQNDASSVSVATLMRKPFYVHPNLKLNTLFRKFKQQQIHMAIVVGPKGEATGVVTMSDILDALFEDLFPDDEDDLDGRRRIARAPAKVTSAANSHRGKPS